MYSNCVTQEAANRQQEFALALLEQMSVQPYSKITVGQLCREIGVSRNAFYRYFDSKDDVLHALIDYKLLEFYQNQTFTAVTAGSCRIQTVAFLQYWKEQKPLLDALSKNNLRGKLIERCMNHDLLHRFAQLNDSVLSSDESRYQIALFVASGIFTLIMDWHLNDYKQPISEMATTLEQIMFKPLIALNDSK